MLKKTIVLGLAGVLLMGLMFGRDACSYVTTSFSQVHQNVKDSVPIGFEIDRARKAIAKLAPEIERNYHLVAKEEVAVDRLARELKNTEQLLAKEEGDMFRLNAMLKSGSGNVKVGRSVYTVSQVKQDLAGRLDTVTTIKEKTDNLAKVLNARQNSLKAAEEKLKAMIAAKRKLEVDIENLEARMKMVEVAQTTSELNLDDSQLARTRDMLDNIRTRLDVAEKLVNNSVERYDRIQLDDEEELVDDIANRIDHYFDPDADAEYLAERN